MSKVAVDTGPLYGGSSKIPRFNAIPGIPVSVQAEMDGQHSPQRPSRLLQMQNHLQQKLLREKEQKLINMYEENQRRAMERVNQQHGGSQGSLRDFFRERRQLAKDGNSHLVPSINQHYRQKQQLPVKQWAEKPPPYPHPNNRFIKNSAGRDKSNLLAPIERGGSDTGPSLPRRPQIVRPKTYKGIEQVKQAATLNKNTPRSAPLTHTETQYSNHSSSASGYNSSSTSDDTPPPNLAQLKELSLQKRRNSLSKAKEAKNSPASYKEKKPSEFQQWQMDQDKAKQERLQKHRDRNSRSSRGAGSDDEEGSEHGVQEELASKQQELMAQIAAQQAELLRLRNERMNEEEEERKERERRKHREEERRKRLKEEELTRRLRMKEEEEERKREQEEEDRQFKKRLQERLEAHKQEEDARNIAKERHEPSPPLHQPQQRHTSPPIVAKPRVKQSTLARQISTPAEQPGPKLEVDTHLYDAAAQDPEAFANTGGSLAPCPNCGRKFASDRLDRHRKACKNLTKKRKPLDPVKLRTAGTEMAKYVDTSKTKQKSKTPKKSNWRAKHESFIQAIKYAKQAQQIESEGGSLADLPPPPPSDTSDYVQCPHCTRRFNAGTAERHIPKCKETKARPAPPRRR